MGFSIISVGNTEKGSRMMQRMCKESIVKKGVWILFKVFFVI